MTDPMSTPPPPPPGGEGPPPYGPTGGTEGSSLPWENRQRSGFMPSLIETVKLVATAPRDAYGRMQRMGDFMSPLLYAIIVGSVGGIIGQLWSTLFSGSMLTMLPAEMRDQMGPMMAAQGGSLIMGIIMAPIMVAVGVFVWSGIVHLVLMMLKGTSDAGFEGTMRAISYSYTANLAQIIPFVGGLIALVWTIFLQIIGLARLHQTTEGKAAGGVLIPIALCCLCVILGLVLAGGAIMSAVSQAGG
ncbi:MAG: YIP1 family protein [Acidobacteriota bacterium]